MNGLVSRRHSGIVVAAHAQVGGTLVSLLLLFTPAGSPTASAMWWGALSGLGAGIGVAFRYRAMRRGPMSVVAPISDVGALALPAVFGIALLGERPSPLALGGIVGQPASDLVVIRRRARTARTWCAGGVGRPSRLRRAVHRNGPGHWRRRVVSGHRQPNRLGLGQRRVGRQHCGGAAAVRETGRNCAGGRRRRQPLRSTRPFASGATAARRTHHPRTAPGPLCAAAAIASLSLA
nr:hypothetical protein [Saccharopolyspora spinosa]